jgi:HJR/Mrr/RecB family endonuclease
LLHDWIELALNTSRVVVDKRIQVCFRGDAPTVLQTQRSGTTRSRKRKGVPGDKEIGVEVRKSTRNVVPSAMILPQGIEASKRQQEQTMNSMVDRFASMKTMAKFLFVMILILATL